ncbi:DUF6316 family protein [Pseudomonas fluorescens]|uniref:DUF6316 domain-containing protein n=1 Tax=Pseudomonas fluorescens TaxID=294 RepID=A0A5E7FD34_PSEFL|nr:DUF6316 family protein [Pseudomonas fluorescens]VVO37378.1 hypothetical protein PS723_05493 [Pseudomonas fluorescens]
MFSMRTQDPAPTVHFRCGRVCRVNGHLYFTTRERTLEGPFSNQDHAEQEIRAYIERVQAARAGE